MRTSTLLGGRRRTNGSNMGEPITTRKGKWLEEANTMKDWVMRCKSKKEAEEFHSFELSGKDIFSNYDETKSKVEKNKKNGSKKHAHRRQSVRYRSSWKQGNIKMTVSKNRAKRTNVKYD